VIALIVVAGFTPVATAQTEKTPPNLTVLTIGVSRYKAPGNDLNHAAKDARDLAAALKTHEGKLFARVVAASGLELRRALIPALEAVSGGPLPRLWRS